MHQATVILHSPSISYDSGGELNPFSVYYLINESTPIDSHLTWSIISSTGALLFCFPVLLFTIPALIFSIRSMELNREGKIQKALIYSNRSKFLNMIATIFSIIMLLIVISYFVLVFQNNHKN